MRTEKKRKFVNASERNVNKEHSKFAQNKHQRMTKQQLFVNVLQNKLLKRKSRQKSKK